MESYFTFANFDLAALATAFSLSMDAFSVSICMGICHGGLSLPEALSIASAFGLFQFFMPLLGGACAAGIVGYFSRYAHWIAAAMIAYVGVNMLREALSGEQDDANCCMALNFRNLMMLAVATSLDALAVGFSLQSLGSGAFAMGVWAGIITFAMSLIGALGGNRLGQKLGNRAEILGGTVLCLIAVKVVFRV